MSVDLRIFSLKKSLFGLTRWQANGFLSLALSVLLFTKTATAGSVLFSDEVQSIKVTTVHYISDPGVKNTNVKSLFDKPLSEFATCADAKELLGKKNVWIKIEFENTSTTDRVLTLSLGRIPRYTVFINKESSTTVSKRGYLVQERGRGDDRMVQKFVVSPSLKWGQILVHVNESSSSNDELNIKIEDADLFNHEKSVKFQTSFFIMGLVLIMLIYHALLYFFTYDKTYIYFSIYLGVILYMNVGNILLVSFPNHYVAFKGTTLINSFLTSLFYFFMMVEITMMRDRFPKVFKVARFFAVLSVFICASVFTWWFFSDHKELVENATNKFMLFYYLLSIGYCIPLLKTKDTYIRYFILGTFSLLLCISAGVIMQIIIPHTYAGVLLIHLGVVSQIIMFSFSISSKFKLMQEEKIRFQSELICQLEENQQLQIELTNELEAKVRHRTREIENQKKVILEKNDQILSSIAYAKNIQQAMLPQADDFQKVFPESFVLFRPRDIVGGDFYWMKRFQCGEKIYIVVAAADCTGHGVPGGFISMLGISVVNDVCVNYFLTLEGPPQASAILETTRAKIKEMLRHSWETASKDGMDLALLIFDNNASSLVYSGANAPMIIIRDGVIKEYKPTRSPIGIYPEERPFFDHVIEIMHGDCIYVFSDGYQDQFGGEKGKRYTTARFKTLLTELHSLPFAKQKDKLEKILDHWMGDGEQVDDVMVLGLKTSR